MDQLKLAQRQTDLDAMNTRARYFALPCDSKRELSWGPR